MSTFNVVAITPSKFGEGDRWRIKLEDDWYDAYLSADAGAIQPGEHALEWKTSQKTGKHFIVAVDGGYRTSPGSRPAAPLAPPGPAPGPRPQAVSMPAASNGQKDMWIMATSILQAMIARPEPVLDIVELARLAASAGRAAARVFDGAPVDVLRQVLAGPPSTTGSLPPKAPMPTPNNPPQGAGDPSDPRNTGPDFDDDIPF